VNTFDHHNPESKNREFVRLLAEHERRLSAYVHTLVPLWQDAEDVLQSTKLRLWEQFETFELGTDFAAWAFTVARYMVQAHNKRCQRQRLQFNDELLEKITQFSPACRSSLAEDRLSALVECVKRLNEGSRNLLHLFCTSHRKIKDIAHDLGQSSTATRMALLRIRRTLFDCAKKRIEEEQSP
jgi:RNA polymerase sigma-70 factor (ECF subfamily)